MTDGGIAWRRNEAHRRERINSGELRPGDRVPSEELLRQEHEVSRATVRRASSQLQHEGLLVVRHPFGTFVATTSGHLVLRPGDAAASDGTVTVTRSEGAV